MSFQSPAPLFGGMNGFPPSERCSPLHTDEPLSRNLAILNAQSRKNAYIDRVL